ncbi:MAG: YdeI/OmpD-associated family protein [Actinomycetales bacterium]
MARSRDTTPDEAGTKGGLPIVTFEDLPTLERWYDEHADTAPGMWVRFAKAGSGARSVSRADALDVALCHGWIDGQAASVDESWWLQRFTPRRSTSRWSQINCAKAEELIAAGRMRERGRAEVDAAKADGRWDAAYAGPRAAQVPPDQQAAIEANPAAAAFFPTLSSQNRYAILHRLGAVKRPETRARKIEQYVAMLAAGETIHPARR